MKTDILAFGVHPDDIELGCSGTLFKHISMGYSVALCDLTQGELGTRGSAELRLKEAEAARKLYGDAVQRINLGMADGFFSHDKQHILKIVRVIRQFKPEIVLCNAISDRHPDHGRAAKLVSDACFFSGLIKIHTIDDEEKAQEAWRPKVVYHYIQDRNLKADFAVDITEFIDKKMDAIRAFSSQFYSPDDDSDEPQTPISSKSFFDFNRNKNQVYGRDIGAEYAEGFTVERKIGVNNLFDIY